MDYSNLSDEELWAIHNRQAGGSGAAQVAPDFSQMSDDQLLRIYNSGSRAREEGAGAPGADDFGRVDKAGLMKPEDFADKPDLDPVSAGVLNAATEGIDLGDPDEKSFWGIMGQAFGIVGNAMGVKALSKNMQSNLQQIARGKLRQWNGEEVPFDQLDDAELDYAMDKAGVNGWAGFGRRLLGGIGANAMRGDGNLLKQWDDREGVKYADDGNRKRARLAYAQEIARGMLGQQYQMRENAKAELKGRKEGMVSKAARGLLEQGGYTLPFIIDPTHSVVPFLTSASERFNELGADELEVNDDGDIVVNAERDSTGSALGKAAVGGALDVAVERLGGELASKAGGLVLKNTLGRIPLMEMVGGKLAKTELGASVAGLARKMNLVGRVTGMQTMPEEVIEEWQNDLFDKGFGLRMRASEKEGTTTGQRMLAAAKDFWSGENMKELATSMLLMQVLQSGGAHVADRIGGRRFDAILKDVCGVEGRELKYYTAQEKEAALARWADDMSEEDVRKAFKGGAKAVDGLLKKIEASAGSFDFSTEGATGEGRVQFRVGSWQDRETDTGVKFRAMQDEASGVTIEERQDAQSGKRLYRVVGADGDVLFGRNEQEAFRKANILANQNDTRAAKLGAMRRMGGVTDADVVGDRWSDTLAMFGERYGADELARLKADPEFRRGHNPLNPSMRWKLADGRSVNLYTLDNIHDQDQMAAYIGHERAIHTGLDAVLGPDKSQFLKAMDGEALEPEERIVWERRMEAEAKARGITVQDIMSGNSPAALKAAEEVYAWTMERVRHAPTMLQSVDASLRKMYRAKFKQDLPYNASELYVMANTLRSRMLGPTGRFSYRSAAETDRLAKEEADSAQAEADRMTAENREVLRKNLLGDKPLALPYRTADKSIGSSTSGLTKAEAAQREKFAKATGRTAQKPNAGQAAVPMQDRFTQEVVDTPDPDNVWSQLVWQAKNNAAEIERHFPGAKPSAPAKKGGEGEVIDVPGTAEDVQLNDKRPSAPLTEDEKALRQMEENDKLMEKYPYLWAYRAMENQQDEFKTAEAVARDLEEDAKNPEREPAEQWAHKQFIVNQMENGDDLDADDVALLGEFGFTPEIMKAQFGYEKGPNGGMVWTGEYEEPGRGAAAPAAKKATRPKGPSRRTQRRAEARKRVEEQKAKAAGAAKAAPAEPAKPTAEPKPAPAAASTEPAKPAPAAKPVQKASVAAPAPGGTTSRATPANAIPMPKSSQAGGQKAETKRKVPVLSKKVEGNSARSYKSAAQAAQGFKDALKNLAAEVGRRLSGRTYKTQQEYETLKDSVLALPSIRSALERMAAVSEWFIGNPRAQIFVRDNIGGKVQHERSLQVETKFRLSNGRREKLSAKPTRGWEIREVIPVLSSVDKLVDECVKGDGAKREIVRDALMEELHRLVNERYASWRRMQDAIRSKPENVEAYNRRADNMNQQARTMGISALMKQAVELGWGTPLLGEFVARGRERFMAVPNEKSDDDIRQWFEDLPRADQILLTRQGRDLNTNQGNVQADSFTDFIFDAADLHGADVLEQIAAMLDDYHKLNAWANDVWSNRKDIRMEEAHEMLWAGMTFEEWREEAKKADTFPAEQVEFAAQEFNRAVEDGMSVVAENAPGLIDYAGTRMQVVGQDETGWTLQDLATGQVFRVNAKNAQEVQDDAGTEEGAGVRVRDASGAAGEGGEAGGAQGRDPRTDEEVGDANWRIIGEAGAMRRYAVPQFKDGADRFATAQDLEDAGASREEIWNKTGWWRGDDNQWRIEIPDFSTDEMGALYDWAREHEFYEDDTTFGMSIREFLTAQSRKGVDIAKEFPGFNSFQYEYPGIAGLEIQFRQDMKSNNYGALVLTKDGRPKYIKLNENADWFASFVHELQHAIQRTEGFTTGGNTKVGAGKIKDADLQTIAERVHQAVKSAITWYKRIGEQKAVGWCLFYLNHPEEIAKHHGREHQQMLADVAEIAKEYEYESPKAMLEAVREAQKGVSAFARYRELGGEVEARLAELRSRMSPDERWLEAPWDTQAFMLEREAAGDAPWEIYDKFRDRIDTLKSSVAQQFGVEPNGQMTFGADWRRADYKPSLDAQALADAMGLTATDIQRLSLSPAMMMAFERTAKMLARAGSVNAVEDDIINAFGEGYAKGFKELFGKGRGRVWKVVRTKLQDAMLPLKMLEEKIGVKTEGSAYHAFDFGYGKVDRDWSNFEHDLYDPLKRELVKLGLNTKEGYARFKLALIALHGRDYNRMIAERSPVVRKLLDDPKMPVVMKNAIWDFVNGKVGEDAFKKVLVDMAADSGRFTEQDRADLVRALTGAGGSTAYFAEELRKLAADGLLTTELDKDGHNRVTGGKAAKAVRLVHEMNARTRQRLIESGRLSKRQADLWEKLSPNYVPLRDDMESDRTEMAKFFWGKEGTDEPTYQKSYKDAEFHHATGRNTLADDPLFFSVQQYQTAIQRAADNEARLNLANIVRKQNEGDASRVGKVFRVMGDEERAKVQEKLAVIRKAEEKGEATPEQVALRKELETALEEANNATGSVPTSRVLGADGMIYLMPHVQAIEADNDRVVAFKENGELKFVELGGFTQNLVDEKGALSDTDAALIGRAVKKSSMKKLGDVSKFVRKLTGAFSALRTAWSPAFVVTNFLADNGQAARNIYADFGLGAVGTFENYAFPALKAARNMLNRAEPTNELERFAKEWFDQGGKIGGITTETFRDIEKEFQQALKFLSGGASSLKSPKAVLDFIGKKVGRFNEIVETSTRIAAYATCRKNGYTAAQAASYARDITVNFNRKGEWSPVLNAWYAFSNASIQDIQRSGLAFAGKRGVPLMMGLYAIGYLCAALGFAQDDPEEEKEGKPQYGDTREYRKQNAISFRFGDHTVNFPIRGISRWFMYAGEKSYEAMFGRTSPAKMAGDLVWFGLENGLDPIGLSSTPAQTFTPSIFRPLMELVENQSFSGSQIYRAPMNDYQVRSEMGRKATGTAFKEIARLVNSATGGTRADRGLIDWQPEVYQQVWNGLLGSVGRDIGQAATFVTDLVENGAPRDVRNVPFASRVIGKLDENSARFHEADNRFKAVQQSWKGTDDTDAAARRDIVERHPYMDPKRGDWLAELKDLSNICRNLTSQEMKARGDDDLEAIHELRLKAQYLFLHRIEVDPRTDNPAARLAEREHSRIAEKFVKGRKAEEKREEKKGERARKHL